MEYINQDITTVTNGIIGHGTNASGAMNSGVAKAIRQEWPIVYSMYKQWSMSDQLLGKCQYVHVSPNLYVVNMFTQHRYGYDGKAYADINAVECCLVDVFRFAKHTNLPLYLPKIASDRGGLDWESEVAPVIEAINNVDYLKSVECNICVI